jgi:hypothetical protein
MPRDDQKLTLEEMAIELAAMRSQRDSWETGYYRELTRRKELERAMTALYEKLEKTERKNQ